MQRGSIEGPKYIPPTPGTRGTPKGSSWEAEVGSEMKDKGPYNHHTRCTYGWWSNADKHFLNGS